MRKDLALLLACGLLQGRLVESEQGQDRFVRAQKDYFAKNDAVSCRNNGREFGGCSVHGTDANAERPVKRLGGESLQRLAQGMTCNLLGQDRGGWLLALRARRIDELAHKLADAARNAAKCSGEQAKGYKTAAMIENFHILILMRAPGKSMVKRRAHTQ
nr:hypothetical protein [Acidipila sp. EB88]